jgi:hypothetical protein
MSVIAILFEPICSIPPTNSFDAEEAALIALSRTLRMIEGTHAPTDTTDYIAVQLAKTARRMK